MKITVENLRVSLEKNEILKGISLETKEQKVVGVIGPNGSGKSTMLKCIYRILKPTAGSILIDDELISRMKEKDSAKKMAVVTQHNQYNFEFSVMEVVLMGRAPHKKLLERDTSEDYRLANEALEQVGMLEYKERSFSSLSGGEQQRVILARALAQQTECLILDEPTNHLDITHQLQLMKLIRKLGLTVVAAIHDLNIAASYCDYLYVMKGGEIIAEGRPEDVLTKELLQDVYQVETERVVDSKGNFHLLYV